MCDFGRPDEEAATGLNNKINRQPLGITTMAEKIALNGLTKRFGPILAVDNISLSVAAGEVLGFLCPNGAG